MATKLAKIIADFQTQLSTQLSAGGSSVILQSNKDVDGNTMPNGNYYFTFDGNNGQKEHLFGVIDNTNGGANDGRALFSSIQSISRQGVATSNAVRLHRVGAEVVITDFAHILRLNNLFLGVDQLDHTTPLTYDGTASITGANMLATKAYADALAIAGAPNATLSLQGLVQLPTQVQVDAKTGSGSLASLAITPDKLRSTLLNDGVADTGSANAYAIAPSPALAAYAAYQIVSFVAGHTNTTASTVNVNSLGVIAIKKLGSLALVAGDIVAGMLVLLQYDGTNFQMLNPVGGTINATLSTDTTLGGGSPSDILVPSQKAVKAYVDAIGFGSWAGATADGSAHQVTADGFLVGYMTSTSAGTQTVSVLSDSSNPPTTVRQVVSVNNTNNANAAFMIPVKKNDYYKITTLGSVTTTAFFIPLSV